MKKGLKSFTITEMLVLMIVSGIILLGVFEGFELFLHVVRRSSSIMEHNIAQAMSYNRLEYMFRTADSIKRDRYGIKLFKGGAVSHTLKYSDPFFTIDNGDEGGDTLFFDVTAIDVIYNRRKNTLIDTLLISREEVGHTFAADYSHDFLTIERAEQLEEKEKYEN